jgi:hypothetical protein
MPPQATEPGPETAAVAVFVANGVRTSARPGPGVKRLLTLRRAHSSLSGTPSTGTSRDLRSMFEVVGLFTGAPSPRG